MKKITLLLAIVATTFTLSAQSLYNHSVGLYLGSFNGVTYKTFTSSNTAFQCDAGLKVGFWNGALYGFEINPNYMYQESFKTVRPLQWFVGGGVGIGASWRNYYDHDIYRRAGYFKLGVNAIGGLEYKFNIPLALQVDLRPGIGFLLGQPTHCYFDWVASFSVRYVIK